MYSELAEVDDPGSANMTICSQDINYTCWSFIRHAMNGTRATLLIPVIVMMTMFMVVGALGNALVLLVYHCRKHKKTMNLYIVLLAAIDLFACVFVHPYIIYKLFHSYDQTWVGLCKTFEFFVHLNLGLSALALLLIAIDRYFAICRPVKFLVIDKNMHKGIVGVILLSVVISLPLLELYGAAPYIIQVGHVMFVEYKCHYKDEYQNSPVLLGFSCFIMGGFLTETVAMAILYKNVAVTAYRKSRTVMPLSNAHILAGITPNSKFNPPETHVCSLTRTTSPMDREALEYSSSMFTARSGKTHSSPDVPDIQTSHISHSTGSASYTNTQIRTEKTNRRRFAYKLKAAKMLFLVTAVFFFSWLPFFVLRICFVLDPFFWGLESDAKLVAEYMLNHFIYLSNAVNPLIYTVINQNFRQDSIQVFKMWCRSR